jgi:hypothetical protein
MMSRLAPSVYPEYSKVFQLMLGRQVDPLYVRYTSSSVKAVRNSAAVLETPRGEIMVMKNFSELLHKKRFPDSGKVYVLKRKSHFFL